MTYFIVGKGPHKRTSGEVYDKKGDIGADGGGYMGSLHITVSDSLLRKSERGLYRRRVA